MLPQTTLIALACLIANKGPIYTVDIESNTTAEDQAAIQQVIDSGTCTPENIEAALPESVENLLQQTHDIGGLSLTGVRQPTGGCG